MAEEKCTKCGGTGNEQCPACLGAHTDPCGECAGEGCEDCMMQGFFLCGECEEGVVPCGCLEKHGIK